ncbi:hypothetical protein RDWZM_005103 [Blomia tropicalis]|uniref:Uncharacterized protein n=1 Tax=Blomia tropicalis TaxID=40697 RepID=A0A9Q0RM28_BLOTA|nr:hypothetical protein RDWZM_005103 [Blomia tropicalis]
MKWLNAKYIRRYFQRKSHKRAETRDNSDNNWVENCNDEPEYSDDDDDDESDSDDGSYVMEKQTQPQQPKKITVQNDGNEPNEKSTKVYNKIWQVFGSLTWKCKTKSKLKMQQHHHHHHQQQQQRQQPTTKPYVSILRKYLYKQLQIMGKKIVANEEATTTDNIVKLPSMYTISNGYHQTMNHQPLSLVDSNNQIKLSQQIDSIVSNGSSKQTNYNDVRAQTVNTLDRQGKLWHHQRYTTSSNSRSAAMDRINRRKSIQANRRSTLIPIEQNDDRKISSNLVTTIITESIGQRTISNKPPNGQLSILDNKKNDNHNDRNRTPNENDGIFDSNTDEYRRRSNQLESNGFKRYNETITPYNLSTR